MTRLNQRAGNNTTAAVSDAASTGRVTSSPPFSAATTGDSPNSMWRKIFPRYRERNRKKHASGSPEIAQEDQDRDPGQNHTDHPFMGQNFDRGLKKYGPMIWRYFPPNGTGTEIPGTLATWLRTVNCPRLRT
jgi:hypothetical protein